MRSNTLVSTELTHLSKKARSPRSPKFPGDFKNQIVCGDALTLMRTMPNECVDHVITSPPYNLKNSTGNGMKDGRGGNGSARRSSMVIRTTPTACRTMNMLNGSARASPK